MVVLLQSVRVRACGSDRVQCCVLFMDVIVSSVILALGSSCVMLGTVPASLRLLCCWRCVFLQSLFVLVDGSNLITVEQHQHLWDCVARGMYFCSLFLSSLISVAWSHWSNTSIPVCTVSLFIGEICCSGILFHGVMRWPRAVDGTLKSEN